MNDQNSGVTVESNQSVKNLKSMFEAGAKKTTQPAETTTAPKVSVTTEKKANNAWIKNKSTEEEPRRNTYDPKLLMQAAQQASGGEDFKSVINKFNQKPKTAQDQANEDLKRRKEEAKNRVRPVKTATNADQPQLEQHEHEEIAEADEIQESAQEHEEEEHHEYIKKP